MCRGWASWCGSDLGQSIFMNKPVLSALADRARPTILLTLMSLLIASAIARAARGLAAIKRGTLGAVTFSMFLAPSKPLLLIRNFSR